MKTLIGGEIIEVGSLEEDILVTADNDITNITNIKGNNIVIENINIISSRLNITAKGNVTLSNITSNGNLLKTISNAAFSINCNGNILIENCSFNQNGYNCLEIGLSNDYLPNNITINNTNINGKLDNNGILIFGQANNAKIKINNCIFEDLSNPIRFSNKTNTKCEILISDCKFNKWESTPSYAGAIILQDYTSISIEESISLNRFSKDKISITLANCTNPDNEIMKYNNLFEVLGNPNGNQIAYLYSNKEKKVILYKDEPNRYPLFKFKDNSIYEINKPNFSVITEDIEESKEAIKNIVLAILVSSLSNNNPILSSLQEIDNKDKEKIIGEYSVNSLGKSYPMEIILDKIYKQAQKIK